MRDLPAPTRSPGRAAWLAAPAIVLLGLFAYGNSLHGEFVFDDIRQIRDNPAIRDLAWLLSPEGYQWNPNRYVGYVTFALNHRVGGAEPFGYHVVNLLIHLVAALLVYRLVQLLFRTPIVRESSLVPDARGVAFVTAALFVTHPLGTQAVTYVVQRLTSLTALFYLLATLLYLAWRLSAGRKAIARGALYAGVLLSSVLAVRTKEIAFTLPAALALVEFLFFPPGGARRWLPVVPVGVVALLIPASWIDFRGPIASVAGSADQVTRLLTPTSRLDYLRTQTVVIREYLRLLLWPTGQNLDHDIPIPTSSLDPRVLGSSALIVGLLAFAAWLACRTGPSARRPPLDPAFRIVTFGIGWFFLTLSVESSLIPIVDVIYEHRTYLPSIGLFAAIATILGLLARRVAPGSSHRTTVLAGVAIALVLGSATMKRNAVWASALTLWTDAASKSPGKARPNLLLGEALERAGRPSEAEAALRRGVGNDPSSAAGRTSLATFLQKSGRTRDAELEYREALRIDPDHYPAIFNLATLLWGSGRREEAGALYRRYLDVTPPGPGAARSIAAARATGASP